MKPIPEILLQRAEADARPPVKRLNGFTASIFSAVGNIKAAERLGMPLLPEWNCLREILDEAAAANDATAFDDLQKALKGLEVGAAHITVTIGKRDTGEQLHFAQGHQKNSFRAPQTLELVQAVRQIQHRENRAPKRQEIIKQMNQAAYDDAALHRHLEKLGWLELLSE
jgi:hypothetical protein